MARAVKREPIGTRIGSDGNGDGGRRSSSRVMPSRNREEAAVAGPSDGNTNSEGREGDVVQRRVLRSRYLSFKTRISGDRDDMIAVDSDKFKSYIEEVDMLHNQVQKPREQVADAEALLDITNSLVTSVKAHSSEGVTPADFISCLLRDFGQQGGRNSRNGDANNSVHWDDIGLAVSHVFLSVPGCCTMVGPMSNEPKQRKPVVQRKRVRPTESSRPEVLEENVSEQKTDTDKNMETMFGILRKNRRVRLENLILNRNSFAQTVENLFALSFLVKDGRVEIAVDEKGIHRVSPRNAPSGNAVLSGEVLYSHFVFRIDFTDWKLMLDEVGEGEELMPNRSRANTLDYQSSSAPEEAQAALPTTPIRKLSRNRGLVMQEQRVVEDSPESNDSDSRAAAIRKGKRKLR